MRYLCIGEPLVEFTARRDAPSTFDRRAGGDTLNSAVYLARLLPAGSVGYLSRLGDDAMSAWLREVLAEEGIADLCGPEPGGRPGLSFISTDARGERSFLYWRDQAPARRMFDNGDAALRAVAEAGTVLLSGVTLAILLPESRERLLAALERRQAAGGRIVLDTNYRPALWPDAATARAVIGRAVGATLGRVIDQRLLGAGARPVETGRVERFRVETARAAERPFQNRVEREVEGSWEGSEVTLEEGGFRVSLRQPLGRLALLLLEPRADDGFLNWGILDPWIEEGAFYPAWREPVR